MYRFVAMVTPMSSTACIKILIAREITAKYTRKNKMKLLLVTPET